MFRSPPFLEVGRDLPDSLDQSGKVARPAEQLPAHEALGGHDGRGAPAGLIGVDDPLCRCAWSRYRLHAFRTFLGILMPAMLPLRRAKDLPAEDRRVAGLAGRVTPAAAVRVLRVDDELDRTLRRLFQLGVAGEAVGLRRSPSCAIAWLYM